MKKLIMALAIATSAVIANAGAINWCVYDIMDHNSAGEFTSTYFTGGSAYLFLTDESYDASVVVASILDGTWTPTGNIKTAAVDGSNEPGEGYSEIDTNINGYTGVQTGYMVLFDDEDYTKAGFFMVSDAVSTQSIGTGGAKPMEFTEAMPSQWQSVPEPTSGLLLLLGVAGLALRRRRA